MRRLALAALVLALAAVLTGSASSSPQAPQLTCKYGFKYVTKMVHGHKKRVKVCKKKPKPKPPPRQANLELTTDATLEEVTAGNHVVYTFQLENKGPSLAEDAKLTVELPGGDADVYGFGGNGGGDSTCQTTSSETSNHVECNFGELGVEGQDTESGINAYAYLTIRLEPKQAGDYTVSATATGSIADPSPQDATASKPLRVLPGPPAADLSVSLPPSSGSIPDGYTQTVSVTNDGPTEATDVVVTILLPQGALATPVFSADFNVFTLLTSSCSYYLYLSLTTSAVCFDAVGSGQTQTAEVKIAPSIHSPSPLRTDAVVGSYTRDSNLANNRTSSDTVLSPFQPAAGPDIRLAFDQPPALSAGQPAVLPFRLANLGLGDADNLTVQASTTPSLGQLGLDLQSGNSAIGCTSTDLEAVSCTLPELESDTRINGAIYTDSAPAGSYTATVTVTSPDLSAPVTKTIIFQVK